MNARRPRYSMQEFARRGDEIYDRVVRPTISANEENLFVAIDIESEGFELDQSDIDASERLLKRIPDAQIWIARVGHRAAHRIGGYGVLGVRS